MSVGACERESVGEGVGLRTWRLAKRQKFAESALEFDFWGWRLEFGVRAREKSDEQNQKSSDRLCCGRECADRRVQQREFRKRERFGCAVGRMKQRGHIFFKADPKQVQQFVEEFYGRGAKQVLVGDIEVHDGTEYGEALLVVLPKDAKTRAKLFEVNTRAEAAFENDDVPDKGQKYLYFALD